jgi:predicted DCC family thiol-disulfide oxidoreductase YuxK
VRSPLSAHACYTIPVVTAPVTHPQLAEADHPLVLFYDGHCGLCAHSVKFVIKRDKAQKFKFAMLQGDVFPKMVPPAQRLNLPDSMVVLTPEGRVLTQSDAAIEINRQLGGVWSAFAVIGQCIPRFFRNGIYNLVARNRKRLFAPPPDACPLMPPEYRGRFLD